MIFFWGKKKKQKEEEAARAAALDAPALDAPELDAPASAGPEAQDAPEVDAAPEAQAPAAPDLVPELAPIPEPEREPEPKPEPAPESTAAPELEPELEPEPEPALVSPPAPDEPPDEDRHGEPVGEPHQDSAGEPVEDADDASGRTPGLFSRLTAGLRRSSSRLSDGVTSLFTKRKLDQEALDDLEDLLLTADLGSGPAGRVVARLAADKFDKDVTDADVRAALAQVVAETLRPHARDLDLSGSAPQVVVFVGVNGSGKTTTLGKIAAMVQRDGAQAVLAAGDTFRAAAIEQLGVWGARTGCPVVARDIGADSAGLVFDAYAQAKASGADLLMVDTAGRLQNKRELMDELRKIMRVLAKQDASAPHHVLLVLDATVGQNALGQVAAFREAADVTGLIMTKLDGTAKGGVLVAIADAHPDLPIYFTGIGEGIDDLAPFDPDSFARALAGLS